VPSSVRSDEVGDSKQVEGAGQGNAGDTVETRGDPGDLRLVDGEVGRDGAVDALLDENLLGLGFGGACCCESRFDISIIVVVVLEVTARELDAAMTYLRWPIRPAGCALRLGAAARRRPSWNIR
jgi:hypothetical protein